MTPFSSPASPLPGTDSTDTPVAKSRPRIWALVPCAGSGSRAGGALPKQYQTVAGLPMVLHALNAFGAVPEVSGTLLVISPFDNNFVENKYQNIVENGYLSIAKYGGNTRHESVLSGLIYGLENKFQDDDWVMVHDAARCLITPGQIKALITACVDDKVGGLLALPVPDTLKAGQDGRVRQTVDRADKWLAQTPQMFRVGTLKRALQQARAPVTDESSAIEQLGLAPKLVEGSAQNFKVTYPADFALAEAILLARQNAQVAHAEPSHHTQYPNSKA
jgi:2-C-methyl-D-erythritol 4-phosphate cytidylyltransferase